MASLQNFVVSGLKGIFRGVHIIAGFNHSNCMYLLSLSPFTEDA